LCMDYPRLHRYSSHPVIVNAVLQGVTGAGHLGWAED